MDYYKNIFYYYGKDESSAEGETQLENNTTKALINTLQHSKSEIISQFLTDVLDEQITVNNFQFHFQSEKNSNELKNAIKKAKKLFILVLSPNGYRSTGNAAELFIKQANRHSIEKKKILKFIDQYKTKFLVKETDGLNTDLNKNVKILFPKLTINSLTKEDIFDLYDFYMKGSIPDAWIFWSRTVVLIENKTKSEATLSQILRHKKLLLKYNKEAKITEVIKSWRKNISGYLAKLSLDERSNILVDQFIDYLEIINMGELKFKYDDFLAFDELDAGQIKQIRSAHDRLYNLGEKMVETVLQDHWVRKQNIGFDYAGINLVSNKYSNKKPVQVPHYSIAITGQLFLTVFVTFEAKPLITKLEKRYKKEKKALEYKLEDALSVITDDSYYFRIADKWHVTSGGRKQNRSTWFPLVNIPFDILSSTPNWSKLMLEKIISLSTSERKKETIDKIDFLSNFSGKSVYATIAVGRNFKWHNVHERKTNIVKDIEQTILNLKPYYEFLTNIS